MTVSQANSTKKHDMQVFLAVAAAVAAIVAIYYAPFLNNFFEYDDFRYLENMYKGPLDVLLGYGSFRVLSNLSWWPIFAISGLDPAGYNAFSFGMLFLDALAFYFLCRELLPGPAIAGLAAILFAGGSVGTDALLWKCTNSTLICCFFYMISLVAYLNWRKGGKAPFWAASLAAFVLAILSKEEAASLPGVVILLELLFLGERSVTALVKRVAPFAIVIILYIVGSREFFQLVGREPEPAKFFKVRLLHTLLTPWSVFSLPPHGLFDFRDPFLYLIPAALFAMLLFIPHRKELLFAFGWIFLTFVPQSLTSLGQTTPKYLFKSMSRYLFLPSAGAALALALVLFGIWSRWKRKVGLPVGVVVLGVYFYINYARVQERAGVWRDDAEPVKNFIAAMKGTVSQFPPKSYIFVNDPSTGRAYVQQSLRAFYGNPDITWIVDPLKYHPGNGEQAFFFNCLWEGNNRVRISVLDFEAAMAQINAANR